LHVTHTHLALHSFPTRRSSDLKLCYAGVFKQLPNIRWLVAHAGGAVPYLMERLDAGWRDFAECRVNIDEPPSFYLKRLYYDTVRSEERRVGQEWRSWMSRTAVR